LINKPLAMCKELPTSKAAAALLHRVLATQSPKRFRYQQLVIVTMASHWLREAVLHLLQTILLTALVFLLSPSSSAGEFTTSNHTAVPVACLPDQASALLRLKGSFSTSSSSISAFRSWKVGTDCCRWVGVQCGDSDARVTSLDLGERGLESGGLDPALFRLSSLKHLNLAYNDFNGSQLPSSGFERLVRLLWPGAERHR
jgi:hypothetical protein